jgi:hypothetical protein
MMRLIPPRLFSLVSPGIAAPCRYLHLALLALCASLANTAQAHCLRIYNGLQVQDNYSAQIPFGKINLTTTYMQPVGTPLGSASVAAAAAPGLSPETVLWECDSRDANDIYELFSTNGDDRVGGYWEIGNGAGASSNDGLPGYYATWFPYVGIKVTHVNSGKVLTRYWQQSRITDYDTVGNKIQIKAKHLSVLHADLARVSSLPPPGGSGSNFCGNMAPVNGSSSYTCTQPNAYIQFRGPGILSDKVGSDHNVNYLFHGAGNGIAFGMRSSATISYAASCVARNVTPVVSFMPITDTELNQGMTRSSDFTIELECASNVVSGTAADQVALGIKVLSADAYSQAQALGLLTSGGGVRYLLSNGYGRDPAVATGVGVSLRHAASGEAMNFLASEAVGGGASAGWYPVLSGATDKGAGQSGYGQYVHTITATLSALPGLSAKPGTVNATASVLVKLQ